MKRYAVLIHASFTPNLLADSTAALVRLKIFPEQLQSLRHQGEVELRLVLECFSSMANALRHHFEAAIQVRSFLLAAVEEGQG